MACRIGLGLHHRAGRIAHDLKGSRIEEPTRWIHRFALILPQNVAVPEPSQVSAHQLIEQGIDRCRVGEAVEFTLLVGRTPGTDQAAPKPPRQGVFGKQVVPPDDAPGTLGGQRPAGNPAMLGKRLAPGVPHGGHAQLTT